jgi:formylglycine-generating enzyme required for sulfatase activity
LTGSIKATEAGDPAEEGWSMSFDSMMAVVIGLVTALAIATGASGQEILQAGQIIRDCSECPEMMVIHEGTFLMGSSADDAKMVVDTSSFFERSTVKQSLMEEQPQHSVTIHHAFGMGKHPVTRGEFAAFVRESGHEIGGGCTLTTGTRTALMPDGRTPDFRRRIATPSSA